MTVAPKGSETRLLLAEPAIDAQREATGTQAGGRVGFFLKTDDFDRDHAALEVQGVLFTEAPRSKPHGKVAVFLMLAAISGI